MEHGRAGSYVDLYSIEFIPVEGVQMPPMAKVRANVARTITNPQPHPVNVAGIKDGPTCMKSPFFFFGSIL